MDINKPDLPKAEGLFDRIIQFSINNAIWVMMFVLSKGLLIRLKMPCLVFQIWNRLVQFPDMVFLRSRLSLKMVLTFTGQDS
ncbi:Putative silver efflux pump [Acinetobacter baumannii]|nr:Putative silver efflux pump [Acinetobacter baumannii]